MYTTHTIIHYESLHIVLRLDPINRGTYLLNYPITKIWARYMAPAAPPSRCLLRDSYRAIQQDNSSGADAKTLYQPAAITLRDTSRVLRDIAQTMEQLSGISSLSFSKSLGGYRGLNC